MKRTNIFFILIPALLITSCSSIQVSTDYDIEADFSKYKTFAYSKSGIDRIPINDLDKKRILRAVEAELLEKGMRKSSSPDLLISLFTKSSDRININDNNFGGFWYPWYYGANPVTISRYTEGTLFIDFLDAKSKELVWQGVGTGVLPMGSPKLRQERIKEFVNEIMVKYPPNNQQ